MKIYDPDAARTKAIASMFDGIPESMSLNTEVGAMVSFVGVGGCPAENEHANKLLTIGAEYEVISLVVGGFSSNVKLNAGSFNTVMFVNTGPTPDKMPDDGRMSYCVPLTWTSAIDEE
jgi:hypothetical protein